MTMVFETKDSGKRATFDTGMVRDTTEGKPRFDLIRPLSIPYKHQMLTRWAELMARGAVKYNARNWEQASTQEELDRFKDSASRHFEQWLNGETDEDHAAAVFFNIQGAEYVKHKLNDPREQRKAAVAEIDANVKAFGDVLDMIMLQERDVDEENEIREYAVHERAIYQSIELNMEEENFDFNTGVYEQLLAIEDHPKEALNPEDEWCHICEMYHAEVPEEFS